MQSHLSSQAIKQSANKQFALTQTEESVTSDKRLESATLRQAKRAQKEADKAIRKAKKEARKAEQQAKKEARLAKMSPRKRQAYDEKQKAREEFKALPLVERKAIRATQKAERQAKKAARISLMSPEKRQKIEDKKKAKEAFKALPLEERKVIKELKKAERQERKERWNYLSNNWSSEFPDDLDLLVIDGNNMRGGGPKRFSRDDILDFIENYEWDEYPEIVCWFDHKPSSYRSRENIEVKFSQTEIADDLIVEQVESNIDKSILVVTCDRGLALRVLDLGKKVMRNGTFKRGTDASKELSDEESGLSDSKE